MRGWIRKALTRKFSLRGPRGKIYTVEEEPSEKLVLAVQFSIVMALCFTALEAIHMIFLGRFNSEIFSAISLLVGTICGVLIAKKT